MVSAVIPAFNEADGIKKVIGILKFSALIDEIIVVDDGSVDQTSQIASSLGVRVITFPKNKGKGHAMQEGVRMAKNETILFCDGDMYGFNGEGIKEIVKPVIEDKMDMVIGIRPVVTVTKHFFPFLTQISGFRAIKKSFFDQIPEKFISGYQVELAINFVARRNDWRVLYTKVPGLSHTVKESKYGLLKGFIARIKMLTDMVLFLTDLYLVHRTKSNSELATVKQVK